VQALAAVYTEVGLANAHDQSRRDCDDRSRNLIAIITPKSRSPVSNPAWVHCAHPYLVAVQTYGKGYTKKLILHATAIMHLET